MDRVGIEFLGAFGLPPVAFVNLAADLGCQYISAVLQPLEYNPHGYPRYSLKDDRALRREMIAAMRDRGVSITLGEGFVVMPDVNVRDAYSIDLDAMCELGVKRINTITFDPDLSRSFDQFAILAEMAAAVGMETVTEFAPCFPVGNLPTALAAVRHVGRQDFRLLIDTMHLGRSGGCAADVAALDPDIIGYIQLCDVPLVPKIPDYMEEAMLERMVPGTGELPLLDFLAALPRDLVVGLEVPMRSEAEAGIGPDERLGRCVKATRSLLAHVKS
ncbi:MAG: sugar phosphate isomerase/epimerase [Rhodospirillaceae bacterium]|nr:MAG: sugar phosphate isomerase/epimerase [Rhodospirillaceae bacterium]